MIDASELETLNDIVHQIKVEASIIYALARLLKSDCGKNIEYDSIMQSTYRLNDIADFIKEGDYDKNIR